MSQPVVLKVYASFAPVRPWVVDRLTAIAREAMGREDEEVPIVSVLGDMVRLSFEGLYFPWDEATVVFEKAVAEGARGKMDVLDMENWTMTRFESAEERGTGGFHLKRGKVPLNHVMDFSGL